MTNLLTLFCLVDGEASANVFPVSTSSVATVGDLKKLIKTEKSPEFYDVDADQLTLWRVSIPVIEDDDEVPILLNSVPDKERKKLGPATRLSKVFTEQPPEETIHISVQRPAPALRRDRDDDAGPSSKRHRPYALMDAIAEAGLTEKAVVDGQSDISLLDYKERVSRLEVIGQDVAMTNSFYPLFRTACELHGTNIDDMDKLSTPDGIKLPIVGTKALYVREAYKDLYSTIIERFESNRSVSGDEGENHVVVTGTPGIGKSVFLVYLAIRLLAESDDEHPPIIIFQKEGSTECFAFGGRSTQRVGDLKDFQPFLDLPDTWYFVDSSPRSLLLQAKTIIVMSPRTLFTDDYQFKYVEKEVSWRYYMAPWDLEELKKCWTCVADFKVVPLEILEELYARIGGVPRYVLQWPRKELIWCPENLDVAKDAACENLEMALEFVSKPVSLMGSFSEEKQTLKFSSRLIHRWPTNGHRKYRLEWASTYVAERIATLLSQEARNMVLERLIRDPGDSAGRIMFEAYILRVFQEGGHTFEIRDLETGAVTTLTLPERPETRHFKSIPPVQAGTLCIPKISNYACVDMLLASRDLFQIKVSSDQAIKGPPLSKLSRNLIETGWIPPPDQPRGPLHEPRLVFIVPSQICDDFKKQDYLTSDGKIYRAMPAELLRVKQY